MRDVFFLIVATPPSLAHAAGYFFNGLLGGIAKRKRTTGLIEELTQLLDGDDPLWLAFELVPPDSEDTPDQVSDLVVTAGAPGTPLAD